MAQENAFIGSLLDFNPSELQVFQEPEKRDFNSNIYKTNPVKLSKADDGHYRSKVRIIYNPFDLKQSVVRKVYYAMTDADGFFMADSVLSMGDKSCPIFKAWKKVWFDKTKDENERKQFCKDIFQQNDEKYVLVQILEDENQPDLVGHFMVWKLPKSVWTVMDAKMNPTPESKKSPIRLMDYLMGRPLEIDVTPGPDDSKHPERKQREISYDLCSFSDEWEAIRKVDNTPLFTDGELETIEAYIEAKAKFEKAKTEPDRNKKKAEADELVPKMKALYQKALDYLKENCLDIVEEGGYKPWGEELTKRVTNFLNLAAQYIDPKTAVSNPLSGAKDPEARMEAVKAMQPDIPTNTEESDDLPF